MFCYQCEQTVNCQGCQGKQGVCGKPAAVADLQDMLNELAKGVAWLQIKADNSDLTVSNYLVDALFTTVTNVNFDEASIQELILAGDDIRKSLITDGECSIIGVKLEVTDSIEKNIEAAQSVSITRRQEKFGPTVSGLQEVIFYGLKGAAAYLHHARVLGVEDKDAYRKFAEILSFLAAEPDNVSDLLANALATGKLNYKAMELLDKANTSAYGDPEPTEVSVTPKAGKCILVSGHDLKDLKDLLEQTAGKDINIYTHGEMLPALAYPELKKYPQLAGNYGGAWQDQQKEFAAFPGAILMTTNCIQKPAPEYLDRIFTTGLVAFPDVKHIGKDKDFTPVIEAALAAEGFTRDTPEKKILVGFGHNALESAAPAVVEAVKSGAVKHFFLIGGCDGAKSGRNYYTELAEQVPQDCIILTLACGKYRFNKLDFGKVAGLPRLLDIGQCNDAYSAVQCALMLANAFDCGVNELPLSIILSWYEQKAVAVLLSLLYLGVKNIKLGPTLPAFISPEALQVLVDTFNIGPTTDAQTDIAAAIA